MRHRGNGWVPAWEMTASMFVASFAAIALLWGGLVEDSRDPANDPSRPMLPMLVAMLLRLERINEPRRAGARRRPRRLQLS